jgi:hypothetical protein
MVYDSRFDTAKFDESYFDSVFAINSIAQDFLNALNDVLVEDADLFRETGTADSAGMINTVTLISVFVPCRIMPLSDKQRNLLDIGQDVTGQSIGYFKPTYTNLGVIYVVSEGDIVKKPTGEKYRVQKVLQEEHLDGVNIYLKALLKRI